MKKIEYEKMFFLEDSHFWFVGKRFFIKTYLELIKNNFHDILDIGSGTGGTTKFLEEYGKVTGIEKNNYAISLAKKRGLKIIKGESEKLPFEKNSFDLATIFDALYHKDVKSVDQVIKEVSRVLRQGGYTLITDSAFNFLKSSHSIDVYEQRRFTVNEFKNILVRNNFRVIISSYIYISIFPLIFLKRVIINKIFKKSKPDVFKAPKIINSFLICLIKLESVLLRYFKYPIGSSLIILAKKNEEK